MRVGSTVTTLNPKHEKFMDIGVVKWIGPNSTAVRFSDGRTICFTGGLDVVNIGIDYVDIDMEAINRSRKESKYLLNKAEEEFRTMNGTGAVYYKQQPLVGKGEPYHLPDLHEQKDSVQSLLDLYEESKKPSLINVLEFIVMFFAGYLFHSFLN